MTSYEALTLMESARTELRDLACHYQRSGRDIVIGRKLDEAALRYAALRHVHESLTR